MAAIISITAIVFVLLVINEWWWRTRQVPNEFSRKFIHISVGSLVATWPFYLSWSQIVVLSIAFFAVVIISKWLKLFEALHSVQRPTWGEAFFALAVGVLTIITKDKWIYAAAILQMSLADGLAAVIGMRYGWIRYKILSATKSVIGTLTFFITSMLILAAFSHYSHHLLDFHWMLIISLLASLLENVAVQGLDNLLVPILTAVLLLHH